MREHKMKRQIGLILLSIGFIFGCVNAERNQEIGVLKAMKSSTTGCFGAILSPDGEHFYTLREELLTRYRISPFEKIGSIVIDREELEKTRNESSCRVLLSNDKSKLVIVFTHKILLLNTNTGKMLNKFEMKQRGKGIAGVVLDGNELVLLDREDGEYFTLSIRDVNTFKLKRKIHNLSSFGFHPNRRTSIPAVSKIQNRIFLETETSLLVLNRNTYDPELFVLCKYTCKNPTASKNYQKLYVWNVLSVTDHLKEKKTTYEGTLQKKVMVFDQETREASFTNRNDISRIDLVPTLVNTEQISRVKDYLMVSKRGPNSMAGLVNLKTDVGFTFYQYDSGEAILREWPRGGEYYTYFYLTPEAKRHLMMKNRDGEIVPINDATFNKYYRKTRVHSR